MNPDIAPEGCDLTGTLPRTGAGDVCLATAVTDSFVPGAIVMLGSFRAHHPGFEGDGCFR